MHAEAYEWFRKFGTTEPVTLVEFGGRNINGTALDHWPNADTTVLDIAPGSGVDIVADAATWVPDREYQVALSAECFEHTAVWREITATAFKALASGGEFIVTCAGPGRHPHSGVDGGRRVFPWEHYGNVSTDELSAVLMDCGFVDVVVDVLGEDVRAYAVKP